MDWDIICTQRQMHIQSGLSNQTTIDKALLSLNTKLDTSSVHCNAIYSGITHWMNDERCVKMLTIQ
jgi:hypothetical protein